MSKIKPSSYKNVLSYIKLNSAEIREQIKNHKLIFYQIRNEQVEWKLNLPMFANAFYAYVYFNSKIPTQEELFEFYMEKNKEYFSNNNFSEDIIEGIKARLYRTQPSLVRDISFNKYVEENISKYTVLYSLILDVKYGIDLMLYNDEKIFGVNLYTNTRNAKYAREKKSFRHMAFDNVNYIEFPVDLTYKNKIGDYYLYGKEEYNKLINIIES